MEKQCKKCGVTKELTEFGTSKKAVDGREGVCRVCRKEAKLKAAVPKNCQHCGEFFLNINKSKKFCSKKCGDESQRVAVDTSCSNCGEALQVPPSVFKRLNNHYCNRICLGEHRSSDMFKGENSPNYRGLASFKCVECGRLGRRKPSDLYRFDRHFCDHSCYLLSLKTSSPCSRPKVKKECPICNVVFYRKASGFKNIGTPCCSYKCSGVWRSTLVGEANPLWDKDKSAEDRVRHRLLPQYNNWRGSVYERDDYTCQVCGDNTSGNLNAHHLDGYNWCVKGRVNVNNGVTLCTGCHVGFHNTYGYGDNTRKQFKEWTRGKSGHGA